MPDLNSISMATLESLYINFYIYYYANEGLVTNNVYNSNDTDSYILSFYSNGTSTFK